MRTLQVLIILLVVQLAFIFYSLRSPVEPIAANLLNISDTIDRIEIESDGKKLVLNKKANDWFIESQQDFPAYNSKVKETIEKLKQLRTNTSVANTDISKRQLKVADNDFQRSIRFFESGKEQARLFMGSAPVFKRVYVRKAGTNEIYEANLNSYEYSAEASDWYKRDLLDFDTKKVQQLSINTNTLVLKDSQFYADDIQLDKQKVEMFLTQISKISFLDHLKDYSDQDFKKLVPVGKVGIKTTDAELNFEFKGPYENDYYVLNISKYPYYLKVSKQALNILKDFNLEALKPSDS